MGIELVPPNYKYPDHASATNTVSEILAAGMLGVGLYAAHQLATLAPEEAADIKTLLTVADVLGGYTIAWLSNLALGNITGVDPAATAYRNTVNAFEARGIVAPESVRTVAHNIWERYQNSAYD